MCSTRGGASTTDGVEASSNAKALADCGKLATGLSGIMFAISVDVAEDKKVQKDTTSRNSPFRALTTIRARCIPRINKRESSHFRAWK